MPEAKEIWQVEVSGTVYEAAFSELPEWIDAGSLMPGDKVRKGNLRWIEARRVPALVPFFNAKEKGQAMPVAISVTNAEEATNTAVEAAEPIPQIATSNLSSTVQFDPNQCTIHSDLESVYLCDGCANGFCKACPNSYGGTVKICPLCGAMCRTSAEVKVTQQKILAGSAAVEPGFGMGDFVQALTHPFNYKLSLFFGAVLFSVLSVGQSAALMGGMFLVVSALFCLMLSNMLTFGVLSNTVDNFIQGNLDSNFMPDFENFEIWEDVVHPFFLSVAAYLVSFGPFLLTLAIGFYLVTSAVQETADSIKSDLERIPGTHMYAGRELKDQSEDVKEVLTRVDRERADRIPVTTDQETLGAETADSDDDVASNTSAPVLDEESREQEELWAMASESHKESLESVIGKTTDTQAQERGEMLKAFLQLAAPLVVIGFITFLWGSIFFPSACVVAGYSKSFLATINPLVGLDTIKRLGGTYFKILLMGLVLLIGSGFVGMVITAVLSPLELPGLGNLPAKGLTALFGFYFWTVFSCIIGFALFKKADKLELVR